MPLRRFRNPVYDGYFADPFVWKCGTTYYAIGTGETEAEEERSETPPAAFPVLESIDLAHWTRNGRALRKLDVDYGTTYWAPEVALIDEKFWMYYSIGFGDQRHHLRVAVSDHPGGPYIDTGTLLTDPFTCPFAIDPSPFQDDDGTWYLFYARDFLDVDDRARAGTGVVVDKLLNATKLGGEPRLVIRAHQDWQRFQRNRIIYGAVYDWHTIEGPCVRKRHNRYWCLFSGGCWKNDSYGVDYAVADHVLGPYNAGDNSNGPRLLRTIPGRLIGPGHNSIFSGPDRNLDYIAYHAWDAGRRKRLMCIDPIAWTPEGPVMK